MDGKKKIFNYFHARDHKVSHIYREYNEDADILSKVAFRMEEGYIHYQYF